MPGGVDSIARLALTLVGLGLVMAFSPTTFGIEVHASEGSSQVRRRVAAVVAGVGLAATLLAGVMAVAGSVVLAVLRGGELRSLLALRWLDLTAGVLLVVAGVWRWRHRNRPRPARRPRLDLDRPPVLLAVVFGESLVSATGPATMYVVVRTIEPIRTGLWPLAYLCFLVGLAAPYVVLAAIVARLPRSGRRAQPGRRQRVWRRVTSVALLLAGAALVARVVLRW